ncbi:MAG TPA: MlaD family protein [Solirubrobacteraceae bacterium]|nr:MlaD family protein [Solirubrobacteraceae bacterium]
MSRAVRENAKWVAAILGFMLIAVVSGSYILVHQRLRTPLQDRYSLKAEFSSSESLTPGLGQPVTVAGVRVGDIASAELHNGRSTVTLSIDPHKLPRVFANAQALLRPNTPLKDMQIEISPGGSPAPALGHGSTIPVNQTNVPIDADELTRSLDADTRQYFDALIAASQEGLGGRGRDLRALLRSLGPTTSQLHRIGDAVARRRHALARLIHNVGVLAAAAGEKDRQLGEVIASGDATLQALASQDAALKESIARLPATLTAARTTLGNTTRFANALGPTLTSLMPTARRLPGALRAARPLLATAEPLVRRQLRPFVREVQPLARDLGPTTRDLSAATPNLISAFKVLVYVANELGYNPPNHQGYLFWLAWFAHNADSMLSTEDAHGAAWRGLALVSCASLSSQPGLAPLIQSITGPITACPAAP